MWVCFLDVDTDLGQGLSGQSFTAVPGLVPAEYTCTASPATLRSGLAAGAAAPARGISASHVASYILGAVLANVMFDRRISPAAIWDLPPFLTQTNSTDGVGSVSDIRRRG